MRESPCLQVDDGIEMAKLAVDKAEDSLTQSKAWLLLAVGYSSKLADCRIHTERESLQMNALHAYTR